MAIASLVLGICGVMFSWFIFGIPSILAVVFGHVALAKAKQGTGSGRELAIAGLIIGYVIIGLGLLVVILSVLAYMSFSTV